MSGTCSYCGGKPHAVNRTRCSICNDVVCTGRCHQHHFVMQHGTFNGEEVAQIVLDAERADHDGF